MSRLFFWNLERLRLLVAVLILGISAMTVSSILSILPVTPARMLLQTEPVATVKNPKPTAVARMVYYKMFGDDNQLETVRLQDSTLKRRRRQLLWNADTLGEKGVPEEGSLRDEDDDEGLFFYPNGFNNVEATATLRKLRTVQYRRQTQETVSTQVLPVVMMGVASAVIAFAVMLYITDMCDRCRHNDLLAEREKRSASASRERIHPSVTASGDSHSDRWVDGFAPRGLLVYPMLPPIPLDDDADAANEMEAGCFSLEQISLSRLSTMTGSLVDGGGGGATIGEEDRIVPYDHAESIKSVEHVPVTQLVVHANRVDNGAQLVQLMAKQQNHSTNHDESQEHAPSPVRSIISRCSTLTDISEETEFTPQLQAEIIVKEATPKKNVLIPSFRTSLDFSVDTAPTDEERDAVVNVVGSGAGIHDSKTGTRTDTDVRDDSPNTNNGIHHAAVTHTFMADLADNDLGTTGIGMTAADTLSSMVDHDARDCIRDIYLVHTSLATVDLQVVLTSAVCESMHPTVQVVHPDSPLHHRLCAGDFLLAVNDSNVAGCTAEAVTALFCLNGSAHGAAKDGAVPVSAKMLKLTVMSSQADGASDINSDGGAGSFDLGLSDSAMKV